MTTATRPKVQLSVEENILCTWMQELGMTRDEAIAKLPSLLSFVDQYNGHLADAGFRAAAKLLARRASANWPKQEPKSSTPKKGKKAQAAPKAA